MQEQKAGLGAAEHVGEATLLSAGRLSPAPVRCVLGIQRDRRTALPSDQGQAVIRGTTGRGRPRQCPLGLGWGSGALGKADQGVASRRRASPPGSAHGRCRVRPFTLFYSWIVLQVSSLRPLCPALSLDVFLLCVGLVFSLMVLFLTVKSRVQFELHFVRGMRLKSKSLFS